MLAQSAEYAADVFFRDRADELQPVLQDICRAGYEVALYRRLVELGTVFPHIRLADRERALVRAELLREHPPELRPAVDDEQRVHGAVADVDDDVHALHRRRILRNGGIPLRIDPRPEYVDVIIRLAEGEADLFVLREIRGKLCLLSRGPCERKPRGDDDVRFVDAFVFEFHSDARQREQVIILVALLLGHEFLVPLADDVVPPAVHEHVAREQRLMIVPRDPGLEDVVRGLDVPVTVVDADDVFVIMLYHWRHLRFSASLSQACGWSRGPSSLRTKSRSTG